MRRVSAVLSCILFLLAAADAALATNRIGIGRLRIPLSGGLRVIGSFSSLPAANKSVCKAGGGCTYDATNAGLAAMWAAAGPDDVIEWRSNVATTNSFAGADLWAAESRCNGAAGTPGHEIRIRVREGDNIKLYAATTNSDNGGLLNFNGCADIIVEAGRPGMGHLFIGDRTVYTITKPFGYLNHRVLQILNNSTRIRLTNLDFAGGNNYEGTIIDRTANLIMVDGGSWDLHGVNDLRPADAAGNLANSCTTNPSPCTIAKQDSGNHYTNLGRRVVTQDVFFFHGGHESLHDDGPWQIYRRVIGDGDWKTLNTGSPGNHAATFQPNRSYIASTYPFPPGEKFYGPLLVEDSMFRNTDAAADVVQNKNDGMKFIGVNLIFRGNYFFDTATGSHVGYCGTAEIGSSGFHEGGSSIYHNTMYGGAVLSGNGFGYGSAADTRTCEKLYVINNLFQGVTVGQPPAEPWAVSWRLSVNANVAPVGTYANNMKGAYWAGNVFGAHPVTPTPNMQFRVTATTSGTGGITIPVTDCTALVDASVPGGHNVCDNQNVILTWANGTTNPTRTKAGFALSPAAPLGIGDARPLTTTSDTGSSDSSIVLVNPRLFKGDWGFGTTSWGGYHVEYPDCICVGAATNTTPQACQVTGVVGDPDLTTGATSVSPPVNHVAGSPVYMATRNPDGTCGARWTNRGAVQ